MGKTSNCTTLYYFINLLKKNLIIVLKQEFSSLCSNNFTLISIWYFLWLTFDKNQALNHPGQLLYSWQEELGEKWKVQFCTMAKCMKKFLKIKFLLLTFKTQLHKNTAEREIVQAWWKHSEYHINVVPQWACLRPSGFPAVYRQKDKINCIFSLTS